MCRRIASSLAGFTRRSAQELRAATVSADLVCVVSPRNSGWVLESIARSLVHDLPGEGLVHFGVAEIPSARAVYYTHYSLWMDALRTNSHPPGAKSIVFFTHPGHRARRWPAVVIALNRATRVFSMSSVHARLLRRAGVRPSRLRVEIPGVDDRMFSPHERTGHGAVLVSSAYYARKAGEKWVEVARSLPHRHFVVVGRGWGSSPLGNDIRSLTNVELLDGVDYSRYPAIYAGCDVFLSTSTLEGGPMPLLEAMMSNVFPVASATGFGPDVVDHGRTGLLFKVRARPHEIVPLVEEAFESTFRVRSGVEHLTPARYASAVWSEIEDRQGRAADGC